MIQKTGNGGLCINYLSIIIISFSGCVSGIDSMMRGWTRRGLLDGTIKQQYVRVKGWNCERWESTLWNDGVFVVRGRQVY